jgi:hypothetical protein
LGQRRLKMTDEINKIQDSRLNNNKENDLDELYDFVSNSVSWVDGTVDKKEFLTFIKENFNIQKK